MMGLGWWTRGAGFTWHVQGMKKAVAVAVLQVAEVNLGSCVLGTVAELDTARTTGRLVPAVGGAGCGFLLLLLVS